MRTVSIPSMPDDRAQFAADRRQDARAIGADEALHATGYQLLADADRHGWTYQWRWLGVPIIQAPEDMVTIQEIIWDRRPDLIVETGVARGGSAIFHASLLALTGGGTVVGIDIDIRPHNRESVEQHPLADHITLIEGSSIAPEVIDQVHQIAADHARVMVLLDSNHTHDHVLAELHAYADLVTPGQFLVVSDTIVEHIPVQEHRPRPWGPGDNPATALDAFLAERDDFERDELHNARLLLTSSPGGYLVRRD
jgi:cephalosporin hydroxylase